MGYTHYYRVPKLMDKKKFKLLSEDLKNAAEFLPTTSKSAGNYFPKEAIVLAGGDGEGKPEFTEDHICFNGTNKKDLSHETFAIDRDNSARRESEDGLIFEFCKTARKPYDLMVCVSLLRLKHHFPKCVISSDGNDEDWAQAKEVYKHIFKMEPPKLKFN